jgi:methyl-accepting chemotaxis protein
MRVLTRFLCAVRSVPIGWKLVATVLGALGMLACLSWFSLDRLGYVTAQQTNLVAQAAVQRTVLRGQLAARELRAISRELPYQQTAVGIKKALERASAQRDATTQILADVRGQLSTPPDLALVNQAQGRLDALVAAVIHAAGVRGEIIALRQKKLFQARTTFETSLNMLRDELAHGGAIESGVDTVQNNADGHTEATETGAVVEQLTRYRLAMARLQSAALMFMATDNPAAANDIRGATQEAQAAMAAIQRGDIPNQVKDDAQMVDRLGGGIATASTDLIALTKQLDDVDGPTIESASQATQDAFATLGQAAAEKETAAADAAQAADQQAWRQIVIVVGVIAAIMAVTGAIVTIIIARPIRRLTHIVQAIAGGDTELTVPFTDLRDETGLMAVAIEQLRGVMQRTFLLSQMIEQMPVGVMTAEPAGDFRITYVNAEARRLLGLVQHILPVPVDRLVGQPMDIFHTDPKRQRAVMADPGEMPRRVRMKLGGEAIDLGIFATRDRNGAYAESLIIWRQATDQARLVDQFERSVGAIARTVSESADGMRGAASAMRATALEANTRIGSVAAASGSASQNVSAAAAGAEELSASIAEISRQVGEQARIAAEAVAEAAETDASISGLSEAADKIGNVVRLIGAIAGQTNLLALNATIEAARAGDAGKGFAVVAGEVKSLATQTARATGEIAEQIEAMRQATSHTIGALRSVTATIQQMNEIAASIAGAVEEQGSATRSIAEAVAQAAIGTNEVNGHISFVSHAVTATGDKARSVLDSATVLTERSAELTGEVANFLAAVEKAA